ncbi:MAG: hypothetical protein ACKO8W_03705 [Dolichospermum sp.]
MKLSNFARQSAFIVPFFGSWLSVVGCQLLVVSCQLLVVSCWLSVVSCWLLRKR